mgnify:CR=1 FL=1
MYCGTDIIEVDRIKEAIKNTKGFKENIYTKNEIEDIDNIKSDLKYQRYAGRFAAKEAIYKAMSKLLIENNLNMSFLDVEILNVKELSRRPRVIFLKQEIIELIEKENIAIDISISHIETAAIANAIVTKGGKNE